MPAPRNPRTASARLAAATLLALLAGCQPPPFPTRALPVGEEGPRCPDWRDKRLSHPMDPLLGNGRPAEAEALGCVNDSNLARMVADPADLSGGGKVTGPAHAPGAVGAVQRYDKNEVTPLPTPLTTFGGS
jgi:type IV pilus biogenesis protein CpaD/CtpE